MAEQNMHIPWEGWKCVKLIGKGGYGTVYEIQRVQHGITEKAAMKKISVPQSADEVDNLRIEGYDDESITQRFSGFADEIIREYGMMIQMKGNANIVYCDDYKIIQQADGFGQDIYIKMELLTPLVKALDQVATEAQIIRFGMDMCSGLEVCQRRKVIHRDIKPQNIFVSEDGVFKLGDFGIARTAEKTTRATAGIGTYQFMAPEVMNNQPYGSTVDIYSLGLVMYWLLNGRRSPFLPLPPAVPKHGDEEQARQRRFGGEQIPAPRDGSEGLKRIVLKACAFDPKDRYQSAREMREDLQGLSGAAVPVVESQPAAVPEIAKVPEVQEEATVGPVFTRNVPPVAENQDKTVGPVFTPKKTEPAVEEKTVGPQFAPKQTPAPQKTAAPKPVKKKKTGIIAAAVLVLAVVGALFGLWRNGGTSQQQPEQDVFVPVHNNVEEAQSQTSATTVAPTQSEETVTSPVVELTWLSCSGSELPSYSFDDQSATVSCPHWTNFDSASVQIDITNAYGHSLNFSVSDFNIVWEDNAVIFRPNGIPYGVYHISLSKGEDYANFWLMYGLLGETYLARHSLDFYDHKIVNKPNQYYLRKIGSEMEATLDPMTATVFSSERGPIISGTFFPIDNIDNSWLSDTDGIVFSLRQYKILGGATYYTLERLNMYLAVDALGNLYATGTLSEECYWQLKIE